MTDAEVLVGALRERGWTLGVAESLTGGAVASEIVSVPGASAGLRGGVVAYATPLKHTLLGVDAALLAEHGPVHPDVAAQMAEGIRLAVAVDGRAADVGIATTGIAGPDSPDGQPVGTVHIGVATPQGVRSIPHLFSGTRAEIRRQARDAAIAAALQAVRE
ncbi:CinA family protein [Microbacterium sp. NPDC089318]